MIFKIISSILHLGNVYFHRKQLKHGQEGVEVGSDVEIKWAAHLLQLNVGGIIAALTLKTSEMRAENLVIPLNIDQVTPTPHRQLRNQHKTSHFLYCFENRISWHTGFAPTVVGQMDMVIHFPNQFFWSYVLFLTCRC